jgi:flagellar assembly protein FliH
MPPPSVRLLTSLKPPQAPQITVHEELPAYPDLRDENVRLRVQLAEMAVAMARLRGDVLAASEGELVRLALAVAERVAGHELSIDPKLVLGWAQEAVVALATKDEVTIAIAPDLATAIPVEAWQRATNESVRVEVDAALGAGCCEVRTRASVVDASLEGRIQAVAREVGA